MISKLHWASEVFKEIVNNSIFKNLMYHIKLMRCVHFLSEKCFHSTLKKYPNFDQFGTLLGIRESQSFQTFNVAFWKFYELFNACI